MGVRGKERESWSSLKGNRESPPRRDGKREKAGNQVLKSDSTRQPDRAYTPKNETKRNDFPVEHPPTSDSKMRLAIILKY